MATPSQSTTIPVILTLPPTFPAQTRETLAAKLGRLMNKNQALLNQVQISELLKIKTKDGKNLLDLSASNIIISIIRSIRKNGYDTTYKYFSKASQLSNSRFSIVVGSPDLEQARSQIERELLSYKEEVIAVEGIYTCRKCGGKRTISAEKQTRAADEPTTVTNTCVDCNHQWKA